MPRYIRNTVILGKTEAPAGTDATPTGAANALLVSDMSIDTFDAQVISRDNIIGYFGSQGDIMGAYSKKVSFSVELAGSGTAATPPAWGALLQACAFAEGILSTPNRVEYTPVSTSLKTATIYYYDDGALHKLLGCMGNVTLSAKLGEKPMLKFEFVGMDGGDSATPNVAPTLTAWKTPVGLRKGNVTDISIGAAYSVGALSGGTVYSSTGLEINMGNAVNFTPLLNSESVDVTDRDASGSTELDLTAAQEITILADVKSMTPRSLGFVIGTTTGSQIIVHAPSVQFKKPKKVDRNKRRLIGYELNFIPVAGNDEVRIACV